MIFLTDVNLTGGVKIENIEMFRDEMRDQFFPDKFKKLIGSKTKSILWVRGTPPHHFRITAYKNFINKINVISNRYDYVVIDDSTESNRIEEIKLLKNSIKSNLIYIHSSTDPEYCESYMVTHHGFIMVHPYDNDLPFKNRNPKFMCLSRLINHRHQRVMLCYELYKKNLLEHGIVSLGSGEGTNYINEFKSKFGETYSKEFLDMIPIIADKGDVDEIFSNSAGSKNNPGKDCLINLVVESSGPYKKSKDHPKSYFCKGWDKFFITEKTMKFINCKQIPIFLSVSGYVDHLRSLGVDVFDDFVNHSYDRVHDTDLRIKMIVDELSRLISKNSYNNILKNEKEIRQRMKKNVQVIRSLGTQMKKNYHEKMYTLLSSSPTPLI